MFDHTERLRREVNGEKGFGDLRYGYALQQIDAEAVEEADANYGGQA